jgi:hypothetical protein
VGWVSFSTSAVQQLTGLYTAYSSISDLWNKYRGAELPLLRFAGSSALSVLAPINSAIPFVQQFLYKDDQERLASQRTRPLLHAVINTLGSKHLGNSISLFGLVMQSSGYISRGVSSLAQRLTPRVPSTETLGKVITLACVALLFYKTKETFFREKAILDGSYQEEQAVPQQGVLAYLNSWREYFNSKLGWA